MVGNQVKLPNPGFVSFAKNGGVKGRILSATIRRNPSGKYFVSILTKSSIREPITCKRYLL